VFQGFLVERWIGASAQGRAATVLRGKPATDRGRGGYGRWLFRSYRSGRALGEQPLKMLIDPKAGARMAVAGNAYQHDAAGGIKLGNVRCRANWMSPAKMPGEGRNSTMLPLP